MLSIIITAFSVRKGCLLKMHAGYIQLNNRFLNFLDINCYIYKNVLLKEPE